MPTFRGKRVFQRNPYRSMTEEPGYFSPPKPKKLSQHDEDEMNRRRKPVPPYHNQDPSNREFQKKGDDDSSMNPHQNPNEKGMYY